MARASAVPAATASTVTMAATTTVCSTATRPSGALSARQIPFSPSSVAIRPRLTSGTATSATIRQATSATAAAVAARTGVRPRRSRSSRSSRAPASGSEDGLVLLQDLVLPAEQRGPAGVDLGGPGRARRPGDSRQHRLPAGLADNRLPGRGQHVAHQRLGGGGGGALGGHRFG